MRCNKHVISNAFLTDDVLDCWIHLTRKDCIQSINTFLNRGKEGALVPGKLLPGANDR